MSEDFKGMRDALKRVDFLHHLSFAQLDEFLSAMKPEKAKKGETIIKQGEQGEKFYIIAAGEVSIHVKEGFGKPKKVAVLGDGDFFGEIALLTDLPRIATVIAEKNCDLFVMSKKNFKKIVVANPGINRIIQETMFSRKRR